MFNCFISASCDVLFVVFYTSSYHFNEKAMPVFKEAAQILSAEFKGKMRFGKVNLFDCRRLAARFDVLFSAAFFLYQYKKEAVLFNGLLQVELMVDFVRTKIRFAKRKKTEKDKICFVWKIIFLYVYICFMKYTSVLLSQFLNCFLKCCILWLRVSYFERF